MKAHCLHVWTSADCPWSTWLDEAASRRFCLLASAAIVCCSYALPLNAGNCAPDPVTPEFVCSGPAVAFESGVNATFNTNTAIVLLDGFGITPTRQLISGHFSKPGALAFTLGSNTNVTLRDTPSVQVGRGVTNGGLQNDAISGLTFVSVNARNTLSLDLSGQYLALRGTGVGITGRAQRVDIDIRSGAVIQGRASTDEDFATSSIFANQFTGDVEIAVAPGATVKVADDSPGRSNGIDWASNGTTVIDNAGEIKGHWAVRLEGSGDRTFTNRSAGIVTATAFGVWMRDLSNASEQRSYEFSNYGTINSNNTCLLYTSPSPRD